MVVCRFFYLTEIPRMIHRQWNHKEPKAAHKMLKEDSALHAVLQGWKDDAVEEALSNSNCLHATRHMAQLLTVTDSYVGWEDWNSVVECVCILNGLYA